MESRGETGIITGKMKGYPATENRRPTFASPPGRLHPMIIPFPIALWVFSFVADLVYLWRGNPIWKDWIAFYTLLAGTIMAAVAADKRLSMK